MKPSLLAVAFFAFTPLLRAQSLDTAANTTRQLARVYAETASASSRVRFHDDWNSLAQYRAPEWFRDAKFGIFIHWGVYSVPAFGNEWYSRNM